MLEFKTISLSIETREDLGGPTEVRPIIDDVELIDLVCDFEKVKNFTPKGEYGGIIPEYFNYGSLLDYYLGRSEGEYWQEIGGIYVLGCGQCGEAGCWPLMCTSEIDGETVTWCNFSQPRRPDWDYSDFGPFRFDLKEFISNTERSIRSLPANY